MISTRFALPVFAMLSLALVPTVIHSYVGLTIDDGRRAAAVGWTLAGLRGAPTSRSAASIRDNYDSVDWIERRFAGTEGRVTVFVARSFDAKRLYHHPENSILHGTIFEPRGTRRLPQMPDVPVHMLASAVQGGDLAVYALLYDDQFIDSPYLFQVRASWDALIGGRKLMTLFLVHDASPPPEVSVENSLAVRVLHEAVRQFLAQRPSHAS
jgi:hypothetical protein